LSGLERFVEAQRDVYEAALEEVRSGIKVGHWMWFVFPQLAGLGRTETAHRFGVRGLEEARAYVEHPVLGGRLEEVTRAFLATRRSVDRVFSFPDNLKFHSCMTLFSLVTDRDQVFHQVLELHFGGVADDVTLKLLGGEAGV